MSLPSLTNLIIGDRVQLRSGGPEMLVVDLVDADRVIVAWVCASNRVHEAHFDTVCLKRLAFGRRSRSK